MHNSGHGASPCLALLVGPLPAQFPRTRHRAAAEIESGREGVRLVATALVLGAVGTTPVTSENGDCTGRVRFFLVAESLQDFQLPPSQCPWNPG